MRAIIVLPLAKQIPSFKGDYIGGDAGASLLAHQGIHMKFAVGDFDSLAKEEMQLIRAYSDTVYTLNPMKNDSDSASAIKYALQYGYDEIWLIGAFGGRMDHTYYNMQLALQYPNIVHLYDFQNHVYALTKGTYAIPKDEYTYISFFTNEKATLTLRGFAYPLTRRHLSKNDLYTLSNQIVEKEGILTIEEGVLLVFQTKDK